MKKRESLQVVVGAQYGSEAKGHVTQRLTERHLMFGRDVQVIRVAGPNAGHTGYDVHGNKWALRQMPVASVVDGPVILGIAPGSEIDPPVLLDEFDRLSDAGLMRRKMLWVDGEATVIEDRHKLAENGGSTDDLVGRIGSTGKGIGAARAERLMRGAIRVADNPDLVTALHDRGIAVRLPFLDTRGVDLIPSRHVIIEGTQGYGLGLRAGHYPQCTSSDCRAVDFLSMAGINSWEFRDTEVWAVARVFPIRVAGNSGPLKDETTWEALGLPEERTTVTQKVRRVGESDWDLVKRAVRDNGGAPTVRVALTMLDQQFPEFRNKSWDQQKDSTKVVDYIRSVEQAIGAPIFMVTNGPDSFHFNDGSDW